MTESADKKTVLVTGATGFIGRRLVPALLEEGFAVRGLTRGAGRNLPDGVEVTTGDLLDPAALGAALAGVDTAYYLVHSMGETGGFAEREARAARNFVATAATAGLRRTIYLSGLGRADAALSAHLASRHRVADILQQATFKTTVLRSGVILGAGGSSYEIIRFLVRTLPVLPERDWLHARCQPIAVDDVIRYLVGCLRDERTAGRSFDIGGPEVMTYADLAECFARVMKTEHLTAPVPIFLPRVLARWIGWMTPVSAGLAQALLEGIHHDVVCRDERIRELMPFALMPCAEAIRRALNERAQAPGSKDEP